MAAWRTRRGCAWPGCPNLAVRGGRYCEEHAGEAWRKDSRERGTSSERGYGARWRNLRMMVLRAHPLCADPFGVHGDRPVTAREVDHIIPKRDGGPDAFENLQALCRECHAKKTKLGR